MFTLLLLSFLVLYLSRHYFLCRKYLHLPSPGPCLPVLGHIHHLLKGKGKEDPVNTLWQLYLKHNNGKGLIWVRKFTIDMVYVGDFNLVKDLFNNPDVQERFGSRDFSMAKEEKCLSGSSWNDHPGIVLSCGRIWSEQRRFTLKTLKDFGFGKTGMEDLVREEVAMFMNYLMAFEGEDVQLIEKFNLPIINALWLITAGERFQYDDPKMQHLMDGLTKVFQMVGTPKQNIFVAFPWLNNFEWIRKSLGRLVNIEARHDIIAMLRKTVSEHKLSIDTNEPRDFIDMMLKEIQETDDPESTFYKEKGEENLIMNLHDLFFAGSETTSTTLGWAVLYMVRNPQIQEKVQSELDQIVGRGRSARMEDKVNLPYTQAVIMEIQRMGNIAPESVIHGCRRDVNINGMTLPANTIVASLQSEIMKGDQWWEDGTSFRPERFLDTEGKVTRKEQFIPFGIGKRLCLGESLAKTELFLFFTGMMQQFSISPPVSGEIPSEEYTPGLTIKPKHFNVRLSSRV